MTASTVNLRNSIVSQSGAHYHSPVAAAAATPETRDQKEANELVPELMTDTVATPTAVAVATTVPTSGIYNKTEYIVGYLFIKGGKILSNARS